MYSDDDICAIATGLSTSAIAVIRISGKGILEKIKPFVQLYSSKHTWETIKPRTLYRAQFKQGNSIIDDILFVYFNAPHSYTGEDMIELHGHGSLYIQSEILKVLQMAGMRLAQPGEFTFRAYINGKMDLTQAEAVHDIITARDQVSHRLAVQQFKGGIFNEIKEIRNQLLNLLMYVELELDFAEEDVEFASRDKIRNLLLMLINKINSLAQTYRFGNAIKQGVLVAIVGQPNVGKSTLMNALLKEDKSIVSSIPGTTRDIIEDSFVYEGITFRFADTAGIRDTSNEIEKIGVEKAIQKAKNSNIILMLVDAQHSTHDILQQLDDWKHTFFNEEKALFLVLNKADTLQETELLKKQLLLKEYHQQTIPIAAKFNMNIQELLNEMVKYIQSLNISGSEHIITNARHWFLLQQALKHAKEAINSLDNNMPTDLLAEDLRMVNQYLGEITGEIPSTEVLNEIFKRFCIGK
ncbi:MAG: tRNA uridine-5-carboxymethylaminomethyl(34) synthesis GTPase MnmE [Bacteroidales bacterium]|nr:tRNA uridine-5-carboxymethylaminomethyl(34) synthesis GTPase MnmE [Bacteroidales bacterium]